MHLTNEKKEHALSWAHPLVQEWFSSKLDTPTEPQTQGWPTIIAKKNTLISAPTGSGKTLAAFLVCIDQLVRQAVNHTLENKTEVVYVSPLKALSNDIQKNLLQPLHEITKLAKEHGIQLAEIKIAVRTGDTLMRERQSMLRKPPHILVTTPESLYILLTAEKSRAMLCSVGTVIVDEIHALADDKRGAHLAISLERLDTLLTRPALRIGLSATQKPLTTVAAFLAGANKKIPEIINIGHKRQLELAIEIPQTELSSVASNEMWDEIYDRLAELAQPNRSTLVFVNTRRLAERVAHHLTERLGEDQVLAHHGSLSRKLRLQAEDKLKNGELKVLVATASLELGIDIGNIDLVCQIGSPRAIAVALQRVGRAGHWHAAISRGKFFATTRDELLECAALIKAIREGDLDELIVPEKSLDILAQQIVAICATGDWLEQDLYQLIKGAYPYRELSIADFSAVITMLADGVAGSRGRYGAYLFWDRINHVLKARRGARLTAITNGGAIPENGLFTMIAESQGVTVGTLDEDFAVESNRGDVILLGTTSWQITRIEANSGRIFVEDAHGAPPSVPFWRGEAPARTKELSQQVADLREKINHLLPSKNQAREFLKKSCGVSSVAADQIIKYIEQNKQILGAIPTQKTVIAERFFDESGGMQLIIHAPFGARINKAWGLALRKKFCRSFNFELQAAATDNGINIALAEQHSFPLSDVFKFLHPHTVKAVLTQAVLQSPIFNTRWRWDATRSLAVIRFRNGKKVPPNILRMLSDDLLAAVFPDAAACQDNLAGRDVDLPDHPLINETMKDVLTEALDVEGLVNILQEINDNTIECLAIDTPAPSPFSHEILNANPYAFLDDAPLEERRARAVEMRRILPESMLEQAGQLDVKAIQEVQMQAWPDIRNADELQDLLQTLIALPENFNSPPRSTLLWSQYFADLIQINRATIAIVDNQKYWLSAEKVKTFLAAYPQARITNNVQLIETESPEFEAAILILLRGWLLHLGPTTITELSELLQLNQPAIEIALLKLEASGYILRGHFRADIKPEIEWCERRLLARIHRLTLDNLRREIEPVSAMEFMRWLVTWQHLAPQTQLQGEAGLLEIIKQLQGFELPANAWERDIFSRRLSQYDRDWLDHLCLTGAVGWGRLSTATEISEQGVKSTIKKRIKPTSVAPITFFVRAESDWIPEPANIQDNLQRLSYNAHLIYDYLKTKGASFFNDIERGTGKLKAEIELALWELVTAGLITADGFDNLRAIIDPRRRLERKYRHRQMRYSTGRWSLLHLHEALPAQQQLTAVCWMLLNRYGVIFRDLLVREKNIPRWRELLPVLRRLEAQGEIRGGRFVSGFYGEQYALPYAVDSIRAMRKKAKTPQVIVLSAADPLNLYGILLPGEKIPSNHPEAIQLAFD